MSHLRKSLIDTYNVYDLTTDDQQGQLIKERRERNYTKEFYIHMSLNGERFFDDVKIPKKDMLLANLGTEVTNRQAWEFYKQLEPNVDEELCTFNDQLVPEGDLEESKRTLNELINSTHDWHKTNDTLTYYYTVVDNQCVAAMEIETDVQASNDDPLGHKFPPRNILNNTFTKAKQKDFKLEKDQIPIYVGYFCADVQTIKGAGAIAYDHLYNYLLNKGGKYVICLTALNVKETLDFYEGRNMQYVRSTGRTSRGNLIPMKAVVGVDNPPSTILPAFLGAEERRAKRRKKAVWEEDDTPIYFPPDSDDEETRGTGISNYTKQKAKKLGVKVRESKQPKKKLDVYKDDDYVTSIGAKGYKDYPTHLKEKGLDFANERRALYKKRHEGTRHKIGSPSYYADQLLW